MVYVYAVTATGASPPEEPGHRDTALRAVPHGRVLAVVSDVPEAIEPSESALWRHEAVVEALMAESPVLPMRFGTALSDDDTLRQTLERREQDLFEGLERVRGAVELGVRALWDPEAEEDVEPAPARTDASESPGGAGTTYLMRRLGQTRRSESLADDIHTPLAGMARSSTRRLLATPRLLLSGAYLVDEELVKTFRERVDELDERLDSAAVICTGPWPPYSFVPHEESAA